jgi:hypothetical protein
MLKGGHTWGTEGVCPFSQQRIEKKTTEKWKRLQGLKKSACVGVRHRLPTLLSGRLRLWRRRATACVTNAPHCCTAFRRFHRRCSLHRIRAPASISHLTNSSQPDPQRRDRLDRMRDWHVQRVHIRREEYRCARCGCKTAIVDEIRRLGSMPARPGLVGHFPITPLHSRYRKRPQGSRLQPCQRPPNFRFARDPGAIPASACTKSRLLLQPGSPPMLAISGK